MLECLVPGLCCLFMCATCCGNDGYVDHSPLRASTSTMWKWRARTGRVHAC